MFQTAKFIVLGVLTVFLAALLYTLPGGTGATAQQSAPRLDVSQLSADSRFVRVGGIVTVEAVIENFGDIPAYNLKIGVAVAGTKSSNSWTTVEKSHPEPITLLPGEQVRFRATIRMNAPGTFQVGVLGLGANAMLRPTGKKVQVIQPANMFANAGILLAIYTTILGCGWLMLQMVLQYRLSVMRQNTHVVLPGYRIIHGLRPMKITKAGSSVSSNSLFRPAKRVLVAAFTFMVLAPLLLAMLVPIGRGSSDTLWAIHTTVGLFAAGWLLVGATMRPSGSPWRGAAAAAIFYLLIGAVWVFGFNIAVGGIPLFTLLRAPQNMMLGALYWPLGVAQVLGLFGLQIG